MDKKNKRNLTTCIGRSWRRTPIRQQKRTPPNNQGGVGRQQQHQSDHVPLVMALNIESETELMNVSKKIYTPRRI